MIHREILLIGHGSRVDEAVDQFRGFAANFANYTGQDVLVCFLELSQPDMMAGLSDAARRAKVGGEVIAVPMFLGAAYHMKAEISAAIRHVREDFPGTAIRYATPLGFHVKLAELLKARVDEALARTPGALPAEETTVLVVGGGSSDYDSNSSVSKVGRALYELGDYADVEVAYQRVTHPRTGEGVARCLKLGATQIVAAPYLLFTGIVHQKTVAAADEAISGADVPLIHADPLGPDHPLLTEVAAQRLHEAASGFSAQLRERMIEGLAHTITGGGHGHHHDHGHEHKHDHHAHEHHAHHDHEHEHHEYHEHAHDAHAHHADHQE
jgi:sirohydrochlorin cobaltochelatase